MKKMNVVMALASLILVAGSVSKSSIALEGGAITEAASGEVRALLEAFAGKEAGSTERHAFDSIVRRQGIYEGLTDAQKIGRLTGRLTTADQAMLRDVAAAPIDAKAAALARYEQITSVAGTTGFDRAQKVNARAQRSTLPAVLDVASVDAKIKADSRVQQIQSYLNGLQAGLGDRFVVVQRMALANGSDALGTHWQKLLGFDVGPAERMVELMEARVETHPGASLTVHEADTIAAAERMKVQDGLQGVAAQEAAKVTVASLFNEKTSQLNVCENPQACELECDIGR